MYGTLLAAVLVFWFFPAWLPSTVRSALEQPDRFELLSMGEPDYGKPLPKDLFHRMVILGSTTIDDPDVQTRLVEAVRSGVERIYFLPLCFNPRHCIRLTKGGVVTDLVICFECEQAQVWRDGKCIDQWTTNASPQPIFDQVLKDNGVPLPKHE